jgi:hypothetical protein
MISFIEKIGNIVKDTRRVIKFLDNIREHFYNTFNINDLIFQFYLFIYMLKDIGVIIAASVGYFSYIALNPKTKGIVFRPNDKNEIVLSLASIYIFATFPFTSDGIKLMWYPSCWDINYPFIVTVSYLCSKLLI